MSDYIKYQAGMPRVNQRVSLNNCVKGSVQIRLLAQMSIRLFTLSMQVFNNHTGRTSIYTLALGYNYLIVFC